MVKVFFSYSHNDETDRNELEKHLAVLKRQGFIETWHDRRILAGDDLSNEIDQNLIESNLILLLVSPDFLASEYCYSKEMGKALEMRSEGHAKVIPIILEHCEWKHTPLKNLLACPQEGKPVSDYPNPNKAFNEITQEIRRVIGSISEKQPESIKLAMKDDAGVSKSEDKPVVVDNIRSGNLRIKKDFTDYEKNSFKKGTFEYIAKYFNNSLDELKQRNSNITYMFDKEANKFYATIYRSGSEITSCLIINRVGNDSWEGITYSYNKNESSINSSLNVKDDGYSLFLVPMSNMTGKEKLSKKGAAEFYWSMLIEQLQR